MDFQQLFSYPDDVAVVESGHGLFVVADNWLKLDSRNVGNSKHTGRLVLSLVLHLLRGSLFGILALQSPHVVATVGTLHDSWPDGIAAAQTTGDLHYGRLFFFAADRSHYCFFTFVVEVVHRKNI